MPVAFAAMLGGCCTLVGTSTNIAASNFLVRRGMPPFRLFEFLPVGLALLAAGTIFFVLFGRRRCSLRGARASSTRDYHVKEYLTEVALRQGCAFVGRRLNEVGVEEMADVTVLGIHRDEKAHLAPGGDEVLQADDVLLLKGHVEGIQKLRQAPGVEAKGDVELQDANLVSESVKLVEVMVGPVSRFLGRTLKEIDFRRRYGLTALAIHRQGGELVQKVGKIPLAVGDILLVQGPDARLNDLRSTGNVIILSDLSHFLLEKKKGTYVVIFFALAILAAATGILPPGPSVLAAALLTVLVGAIRSEEAYRLVDWRLLVLIGGMTAFGQAMVNTGTDRIPRRPGHRRGRSLRPAGSPGGILSADRCTDPAALQRGRRAHSPADRARHSRQDRRGSPGLRRRRDSCRFCLLHDPARAFMRHRLSCRTVPFRRLPQSGHPADTGGDDRRPHDGAADLEAVGLPRDSSAAASGVPGMVQPGLKSCEMIALLEMKNRIEA